MIKGTRYLEGADALRFNTLTNMYRQIAIAHGFNEVILSALSEQEPFIQKAGPEILSQMWSFDDKGGRPTCLIPEATAVVQRIYKEEWNSRPKPIKIFYLTRCYRYERPQAGRYREFWQFGIEYLGPKKADGSDTELVKKVLQEMMFWTPQIDVNFNEGVKRGLDYYVEDGFEVECPLLGAQKQVAGGGRYADGIGFAIGVDRILLAQSLATPTA